MKQNNNLNPSQRVFNPKMLLSDLEKKSPELTKQALNAFSNNGIWMSAPSVNVNKIAENTKRNFGDIFYTPGVSAPSLKLAELHKRAQDTNSPKDWEQFWLSVDKYTPKFKRVAVISDGTRVLGMGDIGSFAGQEVMYGKILLFGLLGGLYGEPHVLSSTDPDEIVRFALNGQSVWGGINLEDIESPKCFKVLDDLKQKAEVAVWHDDQQGTAAVILAGLINSLKIVKKKIEDVKIVFVGFGAANTKTFEYVIAAGANPENALCLDSKGIIHQNRKDIDWEKYPNKLNAARLTKPKVKGGSREALENADVVIGLSRPDSFTIKDISGMNKNAIVFACANPIPEIDPIGTVKLENVAIVGTGRSDFPNQVNNSLFFPGAMAGTLAVGGKEITDEMVVTGAHALANQIADLGPKNILPKMTLKSMAEISPNVAKEVAKKAMETNIARFKKAPETVKREVKGRILKNQEIMQTLGNKDLI